MGPASIWMIVWCLAKDCLSMTGTTLLMILAFHFIEFNAYIYVFCKKLLEINNDLVEVRFLRRLLIAVKTNFIRSNEYRYPIFSHTLHERILIDSLMLRGIAFVDIHFNAPKEQGVYDYHPISLYYILTKSGTILLKTFSYQVSLKQEMLRRPL